MLTLTVIFLGICILYISKQSLLISFVLAGLLGLFSVLLKKIEQLNRHICQLEKKGAIQARDEPEKDVHTAEVSTVNTEISDFNAWLSESPATVSTHHKTTKWNDPPIPEVSPETLHASDPKISKPAIEPKPSVAEKTQEPNKPATPTHVEILFKRIWSWFTDGNTFVRVGVIVLFLGMTFLIQYAIGENLIPIEFRLIAIAAVAIALLYWGWHQRNARHNFSLIIQGGGIGLLYLTIFAAFSFYRVMPSGPAFVLLALIVMLAAMLAITQNARSLALFATVGGFFAPILTSSGSNNYIGLFTYYTLLNLGIFGIAWFKSWRILNFVGFVFTFVIATTWGVLRYKAPFFSTTEPFLIIFFLLFVAIGILFAHKRTPFYKDYVDSSLIFGTPLLAFGLQCAMVKDDKYGVAISAAVLGAFYLLLAQLLWKKYGERLRLLSETFLSLAVIFATLAIPFAIDGTLTGATWAIEGAGIVWVSIKQAQTYRRLFGVALIFAAGMMLIYELTSLATGQWLVFKWPFINSAFIGSIAIAISASVASYLLSRAFPGKMPIETRLSIALLVFSVLYFLGGFEIQIDDFNLESIHGASLAFFSGFLILMFSIFGIKLQWQQAHWVTTFLILPLACAALLCYTYQLQLASYYGYIVWPLSLIAAFFGLKHAIKIVSEKIIIAAHLLAGLIIVSLLLWEGLWQLLLCYSLLTILFNHFGNQWAWPQLKILALGFLPILAFTSVSAIIGDDNLVTLSSNASSMSWSFPPGIILWPFGFVVYFYLLHQNPHIAGYSTRNMHYAGASLIAALLLWLGLWPLLLGAALLALLCSYLALRLSWYEMRVTSLALLPLMLLIVLFVLLGKHHPFALQDFNLNIKIDFELGYVLWPLGLAAVFWTYWQFDNVKQSAPKRLQSLALLLGVLLITWEASWHILKYISFMHAWHMSVLPIATMALMALIVHANYWPFVLHRDSHQHYAVPFLTLALIGWSFLQLMSSGISAPLPWLPLINPIDILQSIILLSFVFWADTFLLPLQKMYSERPIKIGFLFFVFLWANVDVLRAVHHWAGIEWRMATILTADISQTALSLFWGICGLVSTLLASRTSKRLLWVFGAALLAIVVLKLFLIDLSAQETVERIVSFTGVGLLLVLVGYFSPLPPKKINESLDA